MIFFLIGTFCFHLTIRTFNLTRLVLWNWCHYFIFIFWPLGISFAHKCNVCCLKSPGTLWDGGFSPTHCISVLTDLRSCYTKKGLYQGRTGIRRVLFKLLEDTAGVMPESQGTIAVSCAITPFQGRAKGRFNTNICVAK